MEHHEEFEADRTTETMGRWLRFDPHLRLSPGAQAIAAAVGDLVDRFTDAEKLAGRKRRRTPEEERRFRNAVEALTCNALALHLLRPGLRMTIPLGNDTMAEADVPDVYGRHFPRIVSLMADAELIDLERGRRMGETSVPSSFAPGAALSELVPGVAITFADFRQLPATDIVFLRDEKDGGHAPFVAIPENRTTKTLRNEVKRINAHLAKADIELLSDEGRYAALPFDRTVRRYFNNRSFQEGGRLFGGFWMNMRREERFRLIRIDGEPIANVDFGQLFPRIAYVRRRAVPPEGDLYDIEGYSESRDGWKKLMNAVLFSTHPLKQWPRQTRHLFPDDLTIEAAVELLGERHPDLKPIFGTGIGFTCMWIESTMLVFALEALFRRGITALPVHDAVIVSRSHAEEAKRILQRTAFEHLGVEEMPVKIEFEPPPRAG